MNKYKGTFITFEGGEATGKTTQIRMIKKWLDLNKVKYILTREPGGTIVGEKLRKIILSKKNNINVNLEVLLLMSARLDHLEQVIIPALSSGKVVISDRFIDSTAVYQGYYKKYGLKKVYDFYKKKINGPLPDLTFFFNISTNKIHSRLSKRKIKNKYDIFNKQYHDTINKGYFKIAKNKKRFKIIDGSKSINEINSIITKNIILKLKRKR